MPPSTSEVQPPTGRDDCLEWLEKHGVVAREPSIRSSHWEQVLGDPFKFYLTSRLGIIPALSWSAALSRGGWFHERAALLWDEYQGTLANESRTKLERSFSDRMEELGEICAAQGLTNEGRRAVLDRETTDYQCAVGWYEAAAGVKVSPSHGTLGEFLRRDYFTRVGDSELALTYTDRRYPKCPLVCTLDALLYHQKQNSLWVVDWKTCSESPKVRLATCPLEQQTWQYMWVVRELLREGGLQKQLNLPADVQLGGMIHVAIQKPTISLGQQDRACTVDMTPLLSGPRKGLPRNEKKYTGEPLLENYIKRCSDWYRGEGEYLHLKPLRESDPPVNLSFSYSSLLDKGTESEYHDRLEMIYKYATCHPVPSNFPRSATGIRAYGKLSPYAPFYLTEPAVWPEVMRREGFMIAHRDEVQDVRD